MTFRAKKSAGSLADVLIRVGALLVRQLDVETDTGRLAEIRALVGGFQYAGAAARNHREPASDSLRAISSVSMLIRIGRVALRRYRY